ncbi:MAG: hypothetical protein AAFO94_19630 [Bacteroidota bacterium]
MEPQSKLAFRLELIWWLVTAVIVAAVLLPILTSVQSYPFLVSNIVFIIVFITFTRYIFLLKHTFIAKRQIVKALFGLICIPILFYLINEINFFQTYLDEQGFDSFMQGLTLEKKDSLHRYIRSELLLFGVGSIIVAIILPVRMLISVWRLRNRGTV